MPLPANVQPLLETIIGALAGLSKTTDGIPRKYAALFMDLPSQIDYPDYYVYIQQPKSINQVLTAMISDRYDSANEVAHDLFLIWKNARQYNQVGSLVYSDAEKLETCMQDLWNGRSPPLPPWRKLSRPGEPPAGEKKKHKKKHRSEDKIKSSKSSHSSTHLPAPLTATINPAAISVNVPPPPSNPFTSSSNPIASTSTISFPKIIVKPRVITPTAAVSTNVETIKSPQRVTFGTPSSANPTAIKVKFTMPTPSVQPQIQLPPVLPVPLVKYDSNGLPKKELRKDLRIRQKLEKANRIALGLPEPIAVPTAGVANAVTPAAVVKEERLIHDVETGWFNGVAPHQQVERFLMILNILRTKTSNEGRLLSTPLLAVPSPTSRPDYYEIVKDPISLDIIQDRVTKAHYTTQQAFDEDLNHLFIVAKIFIRPETPGDSYADLLILQRLYQELTKTISSLPPVVVKVPNTGWTTSADGTLIPPPVVANSDRTLIEDINFKGQVYKIGDWVHVASSTSPAKPIIGQIFKLFRKLSDGSRSLSICVYLRPEDTIHPSTQEFYEGEVFKTAEYKDCPIEDVLERCCVLPLHLYIIGRPPPPIYTPGITPLYVVEFRYKPDTVNYFKKIRNWLLCLPDSLKNLPSNLVENKDGAIESLVRIPSNAVEQDLLNGLEVNQMTLAKNGIGNGGPLLEGAVMTDAESMALGEAFDPLPDGIASKFRSNQAGDIIWFTTPPLNPAPVASLSHSFEYLYWKSQQKIGFGGGKGMKRANGVF